MELIVDREGTVRCVYGEALDLPSLGEVKIQRASHVEPDERGHWCVDLSPVGGPRLGPFGVRSEALAAEGRWLSCWLSSAGDRGEV